MADRSDRTDGSDADLDPARRVAALERLLADVSGRLERLERENAALRGTAAAPASMPMATSSAQPSGSSEAVDATERKVSRRGLLLGSAGAAAAGAVGIVAAATPAAANSQGQSWTLGDSSNTATATTGLAASIAGPVLQLEANGTGLALEAATFGSSGVAFLYINNTGNPSDVLYSQTNGSGSAVVGMALGSGKGSYFAVADAANGSAAVYGDHAGAGDAIVGRALGTGRAGHFSIPVSGSSADAVLVENVGSGGGVVATTTGTGDAVVGTALGSGKGGFFYVNNPASTTAALTGQTNGAGTAVIGNNIGTGSGGGFSVDNVNSTSPALTASTKGSGVALSLTSPNAQVRLVPRLAGPPTGDGSLHQVGELVEDSTGTLWLCTANGVPGTWRSLAGPGSAGAFSLLTTPVRVYDSRPGLAPPTGPKAKLQGGSPITVDLRANGSAVPAGATAIMVTLLAVDTTCPSGNPKGNLTLWAANQPKPGTNNLLWNGNGQRVTTLTVTGVDGAGFCKVDVQAGFSTNVVIDVLGFYR